MEQGMEKVPERPRQGDIWWSAAPPFDTRSSDQKNLTPTGVTDEQLRDWLSCTAGWKALELTWGAVQSCDVGAAQLKPLLQAALAEASRLGAPRLVVRQLDVDEVVSRCVALALSGFPNFTDLKLRELNLYDEALAHLAGALHPAEHLRALVLDSVWASEGGWATIAAALKVNSSLRVLRFRYVLSAGSSALFALCAALADPRGSQLATLRLDHNSMGDAGVTDLCKALLARSGGTTSGAPARTTSAGHVEHVDLSYNGAGAACVPAVASMLRALRTLRHLDLSYNQLGPEGARDLCRAVSQAPHLASLRLVSTGADDSAVEALVRAMAPTAFAAVATTVTASSAAPAGSGAGLVALSLAQNRITARGALLLAAAAKRPSGCALADVDLSGNGQIGEQGAKAWADVLSSAGGGSRLRRLVLSGCEVPDEGAYALGAALKANTCLRELGLAENHLTTSGLALLAEVVKVNSSLQVVDVSLNMVGPQGMEPFSRMSHPRGQACFSKAHDHSVHRFGSCLVKAELLPEYRLVEAVKKSSLETGVWSHRQQDADAAAKAAGAGVPSNHGAWGASDYLTTDNPFLDLHPQAYGTANPFLSPAASYVNPFLEPSGAAADPHSNPFLAGTHHSGRCGEEGQCGHDNPFRSPRDGARQQQRSVHDNPFLPPRDGAPGASEAHAPTEATGAAGEPAAAGRQLATRVVTRLGAHGGASASGSEAGGGRSGDGSVSGTDVYVSSRSTADEGDLVTDLDMRLVDDMIKSLGCADPADPWGLQAQAAGPQATSEQARLPVARSSADIPVEGYAEAWADQAAAVGSQGDDDLVVEAQLDGGALGSGKHAGALGAVEAVSEAAANDLAGTSATAALAASASGLGPHFGPSVGEEPRSLGSQARNSLERSKVVDNPFHTDGPALVKPFGDAVPKQDDNPFL